MSWQLLGLQGFPADHVWIYGSAHNIQEVFMCADSTDAPSPTIRTWMSISAELIRAVNAGEPLEEFLDRVADAGCRLLGFDFCAVKLVDESRTRLEVRGSAGLSAEYVERLDSEAPLLLCPANQHEESPSVRAFHTGQVVVVPDVMTASQFKPWQRLAFHQSYRTMLAAPLLAGEGTLGVLSAYSAQPRGVSRAECELVGLLAEHTAVAVQAAQLRAAENRMIVELTKVNAQLHSQRELLGRAEEQHRQLMRAVVDDVRLDGVVRTLAETMQASVTVEDTTGGPLAIAAAGAYVPPPTDRRGNRAVREVLARMERERAAVLTDMAHGADEAPSSAWVAPIIVGGEIVARLWVMKPCENSESIGRRGIEGFALAIALQLVMARNAVEVELRLSRDLLSDLIARERTTDRTGLVERGRALGHDLTAPHRMLLVAIHRASDADPVRTAEILAQVVHAEVRSQSPASLVGIQGHDVVVLLPETTDGSRSSVRRVAASIHRRLERLVHVDAVRVVIGTSITDLAEYPSTFRVVRGAARLLATRGSRHIVDLADLGVYALLLESPETFALHHFARRTLAPLHEADGHRQTELIHTLRVWLEEGCSTRATARRLVVHTNTVSYRITRIEKLMGCRLRDTDMLLRLQLALMVDDVADVLNDPLIH